MTNTPDKSEKLLSCPFCGGEAMVRFESMEETWSAICQSCEAEMLYVAYTEAEAIAAWNTRSRPPTDQVPDRDGLAESLKARLASRYNATSNTIPVSRTEVERIIAALQAVPAASGEPTEAMVKAGYDAAKKDGLTGPRKDCEQLVRLILTAALKASGETE